jgi:hypothetical protein
MSQRQYERTRKTVPENVDDDILTTVFPKAHKVEKIEITVGLKV